MIVTTLSNKKTYGLLVTAFGQNIMTIRVDIVLWNRVHRLVTLRPALVRFVSRVISDNVFGTWQ